MSFNLDGYENNIIKIVEYLNFDLDPPSKMKRSFVSAAEAPPSLFPFSSSSSSTLSSFKNVFHMKYPAGSKTKNKIRAFMDQKFLKS